MVVQAVVGALAVVVHLLEVGLGHFADFRQTDPSLATLAVDRQALLLDEEAPNQFLTSGRGGGQGHTEPSSQKLSSSSRTGKGWCAGLVQIVQEEEYNFLEEGCV